LFKKHSKAETVEICAQKIDAELDVLTLYKKLTEIDKLKYLLLTTDQQILFDHLHKPLHMFSPEKPIYD